MGNHKVKLLYGNSETVIWLVHWRTKIHLMFVIHTFTSVIECSSLELQLLINWSISHWNSNDSSRGGTGRPLIGLVVQSLDRPPPSMIAHCQRCVLMSENVKMWCNIRWKIKSNSKMNNLKHYFMSLPKILKGAGRLPE